MTEFDKILTQTEEDINNPNYRMPSLNDINIKYKIAAYETTPTVYYGTTPIKNIYFNNNNITQFYKGTTPSS